MIISHRVNTIEKLKQIPECNGIEVDIRYNNYYDDLILSHNLFGEENLLLKSWLSFYKHKMLILNIKASQCEERCINYMKVYGIKEYYFLDSQIPDIVRLTKEGYGKHFIIRRSQYESFNINLYNNSSKYLWIDNFGDINYSLPFFDEELLYKELIYVSPELYKKNIHEVKLFKENLVNLYNNDLKDIHICTDLESEWTILNNV